MKYCAHCSEKAFHTWRGWPLLRDIGELSETVPALPNLEGYESCPSCSGDSFVDSDQIRWRSCNSEFSTGLPDYWVLSLTKIDKDWGRPYAYETTCPSCNKLRVVSCMTYPDGAKEWAINCSECGLTKSKKKIGAEI